LRFTAVKAGRGRIYRWIAREVCAIASTAAFFISSLIAVAPTSSAPRKMKGKAQDVC